MKRKFDRDRHSELVACLEQRDSVSGCLLYPGMLEVTPEFDRFAHAHFSTIDEIPWRDLCPAYALGLMTFDNYDLPEDDADLEMLWDELSTSDLSWQLARNVVLDVWIWLGERDATQRLPPAPARELAR